MGVRLDARSWDRRDFYIMRVRPYRQWRDHFSYASSTLSQIVSLRSLRNDSCASSIRSFPVSDTTSRRRPASCYFKLGAAVGYR